jgi:hypothetical protein
MPVSLHGMRITEMTDIVERLKKKDCKSLLDAYDAMEEAADEIERLRAALVYEENRFGRIGTHGPNCYKWGPSHYECAMREIEQLRQRLHEVSVDWQCGQAREAKLREWVYAYLLDDMDDVAATKKMERKFPADDTALKEAIKQAKRGALLEAADAFWITEDGNDPVEKAVKRWLRRMAGEIK